MILGTTITMLPNVRNAANMSMLKQPMASRGLCVASFFIARPHS